MNDKPHFRFNYDSLFGQLPGLSTSIRISASIFSANEIIFCMKVVGRRWQNSKSLLIRLPIHLNMNIFNLFIFQKTPFSSAWLRPSPNINSNSHRNYLCALSQRTWPFSMLYFLSGVAVVATRASYEISLLRSTPRLNFIQLNLNQHSTATTES